MAHLHANQSAALLALKQGELLKALELLSTETAEQTAAWSKEDRNDLRWKLVFQRDQGHLDLTYSGLKLAANTWPTEPVYLLELLVLRAHGVHDRHAEINMMAQTAPEETRRDPQIAIHLGFDAVLAGSLAEARKYLALTEGMPQEAVRPFASQYADLLRVALFEPSKEEYLAALQQPDFNLLASHEASAMSDALGEMIVHFDSLGDLSAHLQRIVFQNVHGLPHVQHLALEALKRVDNRLSPPGKVARLALLEAFRLPEAIDLVKQILSDDASRSNAHFARLGATLAARAQKGALERSILNRFTPAPDRVDPIECARTVEVIQRRETMKADRPLEVFIGLFGQMRDPDIVIPKLVTSIQAAVSNSIAGPFNLSFGLSSWTRTGHRTLSLDDAAGFFSQASPAPLHALFHERYGANGHQLAVRYPQLTSSLIAYGASRSPREPSLDELKTYLPLGSAFALDFEGPIEDEVRSALTKGRAESAWHYINQFKMWSRLARLAAPIASFETTMGRPFDACVFIRCDLTDVSGGIGDAIAEVSSNYNDRTIYYDYDPHAEYIEGAGDRYIIASRNAMTAVMSGYDRYLRIYADDADASPLRLRLSAHQGLQSIIYQNGFTPHPVWHLNYAIHRGAPPAATLVPALIADLEGCQDPVLRDVMKNALRGLEVQS